MENNPSIYRQLREKFDATTDATKGYQIRRFYKRRKTTPAWAEDDQKVRELLLSVFPKMNVRKKDRLRAGRWMRVIYLYYRRHWTRGQIAAEMGLTYWTVNRLLSRIATASKKMEADSQE